MRDYARVEVGSREELRAWLQAHHEQQESVWLVSGKKNAGDRYLPYDAIVEEALCFGWIDSLPRKLDDTRSMLLLSPRRPKSAWSKINRERVERLIREGRIQPPGLAKIDAARRDGSWDRLRPVEEERAPPELDAALKADQAAAKAYAALTSAKRRLAVRFVADAKAEATRARRVAALRVALKRGLEPVDWRVSLAE
jgi:uncharacterized protein YdeI (YjbR/CyaY-like superfamily)